MLCFVKFCLIDACWGFYRRNDMIPEICVAQTRKRKMGDVAGGSGTGRSSIILSAFVNYCFHVKSGEKKTPGSWAPGISFSAGPAPSTGAQPGVRGHRPRAVRRRAARRAGTQAMCCPWRTPAWGHARGTGRCFLEAARSDS